MPRVHMGCLIHYHNVSHLFIAYKMGHWFISLEFTGFADILSPKKPIPRSPDWRSVQSNEIYSWNF